MKFLCMVLVVVCFVPALSAESLPPVIAQCDSGTVIWNGQTLPAPYRLVADDSTLMVNGYVIKRVAPCVPTDSFRARVKELNRRLCDEGKSENERRDAIVRLYREQKDRVDSVAVDDEEAMVYYRGFTRPVRLHVSECPTADLRRRGPFAQDLAWYKTYLCRGGLVVVAENQPDVCVPNERTPMALAAIERFRSGATIPEAELAEQSLSSLARFSDVLRHPKPLPEVREQ